MSSDVRARMLQFDATLDKIGAASDQKTKMKAILFDAVLGMGSDAAAFKATGAAFAEALKTPVVDRAQLERARLMAMGNVDR